MLAKLSPADRVLAEQQRTCPILKDSRLGSMGPPVKLTLAGETVFLCCSGCKGQATADPEQTAARVKELRTRRNNGMRGENEASPMIERIIELSIRNRFLVLILAAALTVAGVYAVLHTPVDAIPDLSENQVIVFTDWMGRSPREIEDQVTYPLSRKLQGLAGVKAVRSSSEFNFSMITIIFEDSIDFYFARQRVTEKLGQANTFLPPGVVPYLAPDATALGQIFWYTVEPSPTHPIDPAGCGRSTSSTSPRSSTPPPAWPTWPPSAARRWNTRSTCGPKTLRAYGITLGELYAAVARATCRPAAASSRRTTPSTSSAASAGFKDKHDIENTVIKEVNGTPIYVKNVATVQLGTQFRRSVFEKDGNEVDGGVVLMRHGENPLAVTERVKEKIQELQPGLPRGRAHRARLRPHAADPRGDPHAHRSDVARDGHRLARRSC